MDLDATAKLLTVIAAYDNRNVQRETVIVWHQSVGHLDYDIAVQAVALHFKESTAYLMPGHVNVAARRVQELLDREQRLSRPALEPAVITLDRDAHEAEVEKWRTYYREHPDER